MMKLQSKMLKYFSKNSRFNAYVHFLGGIGVGFLLTYPLAQEHPLRWGIALLVLSALGHIYAAMHK